MRITAESRKAATRWLRKFVIEWKRLLGELMVLAALLILTTLASGCSVLRAKDAPSAIDCEWLGDNPPVSYPYAVAVLATYDAPTLEHAKKVYEFGVRYNEVC